MDRKKAEFVGMLAAVGQELREIAEQWRPHDLQTAEKVRSIQSIADDVRDAVIASGEAPVDPVVATSAYSVATALDQAATGAADTRLAASLRVQSAAVKTFLLHTGVTLNSEGQYEFRRN